MAFQFLHVATYAREKPKKATKGKERKWTVRDIAGEAERNPNHSPHVRTPQEPEIIYGMKPSEAVAEAERRAEASRDVSGRKVRKDTPVLLAGVASHPCTVRQLVDPTARQDYAQWKLDVLDWVKKKYGDDLLSVVQHLDEKHPHLHFYVIPKAGPGFNAKTLHDGFKAASVAKSPTEQKRLYCGGMRALQDDFFMKVGSKYGHARLGPQRRRMSRAEWIKEQQQLQQLSGLIRGAKAGMVKAQKQASAIVEKARAEAQFAGTRVGAFFGGLAGRASDALKRVERERDLARAKARSEEDRRKKAEAEMENVRKDLIHERLQGDQKVKNLVAMKTGMLEKKLEVAESKASELEQQLDSLSKESQSMQQQLRGPRSGPGMGR